MHHNRYYANIGEKIAINFLKSRGYSLLFQNYRINNDEIDIICTKNNYLVFIEVKTRLNNHFGTAEDQLTQNKLSNLKRAIYNFQLTHQHRNQDIQVEFIAVNLNIKTNLANIKHFLNIF